MKKAVISLSIILVILLLFIAVSLGDTKPATKPDDVIVKIPTAETINSVNGYKEADNTDNAENEIYYCNKKTKKFHISTCQYAQITDEENLYISNSREELISDGYSPCQVCNP